MTSSIPKALVEQLSTLVRKKESVFQYGPIGVDLGQNGLRLVQYRKNENVLELYASAHCSINDQLRGSKRELRTLIKQLLKDKNFVGRDIVTCLQPEKVKIMMLSFMHKADTKDEELIVQRITERIDDDIEDYVIDFMMVRPQSENNQERSVLVALSPHDEVIDHLEFLRKTGLRVKLLEIEPTAVRRLISVKNANEHSTNLMTISMGCSQTYITVLSGRRLIYERDVDFGEAQLIEMLCKELDIDEREARVMLQQSSKSDDDNIAENEQKIKVTEAFYGVLKPLFMELVEDINRALIYAASETRGVPVKHVYLTDKVATWQGIENFISTLINVPVSILIPFDETDNADKSAMDADPRAAVVTGMALHGLTEYS